MTFRFAPLQQSRDWTPADAINARKAGGSVWINIITDVDEDPGGVLAALGFHPVHIEDALSPYERPSINTEEGYVFLVAPSINRNGDLAYVDLAVFFDAKSLVTVSHSTIPEVESTFETLSTNPTRHTGQPSGILHMILDKLVDGYYPAIDKIAEDVDELEDDIFSGKNVDAGQALQLKRRLLEMRRHMAPFRDVLGGLMRLDSSFLGKGSRVYYQDIYDHANRVIEMVDNERDIVSSVLDVQLSVQSNRLNQVMRSMTIISTILMTGAFVAGVYGMNFDVMPELRWQFGYPLALLTMVVLGLLEIWVFKKRKWF